MVVTTLQTEGKTMKHRFLKTAAVLACALCLSLSCVPALASGTGDYAAVTGTETLNLRQGPGTQYAWLGRASAGEWVQILGETGNWYNTMIVESGQVGYMSKNFLSRSAAGASTGVVKNPKATQFLNLRQYPSYSAPVIGIFYNGASFRVLSVMDGWVQVQMDGTAVQGYFRQEFVSLSGGAGYATIKTANGGKLNLRSAPSYQNSKILSQLPNGSTVSVLLQGKTFWKVSVNGQTGYMDSAFLKPSAAPAPAPAPGPAPATTGYGVVNNPLPTQYLNLRSTPSTTAKVLAQYKNGIRLEIVEPGETWCKVYGKASGNLGYVMTKYLRLYGVSASPTKTVQNGSTYVNLRSAPSQQTGNVYQRLYSGSVVTVLTPGDEWTQVRYGGVTGYMMTAFLK